MIELSPKALRFARLAAETQLSGADQTRVEDLRRKEQDHAAGLRAGVLSQNRYLPISDDLARFCLKKIHSFLQRPISIDGEWDQNDLLFLKTISTYLSESLSTARKT